MTCCSQHCSQPSPRLKDRTRALQNAARAGTRVRRKRRHGSQSDQDPESDGGSVFGLFCVLLGGHTLAGSYIMLIEFCGVILVAFFGNASPVAPAHYFSASWHFCK
mmetsp:Transcript_129137/g.294723  ORF Transcript_129137/g.294723 Transcript_129137/m.294723 type:complete len:106 (+) Transcript_129137:1670-1987(+)